MIIRLRVANKHLRKIVGELERQNVLLSNRVSTPGIMDYLLKIFRGDRNEP